MFRLVLPLLLLSACASNFKLPNYPNELQGMKWLLGKWKIEGKQVIESWVDQEDGQFYGTTIKVEGKDSIELERIILQSDSTNIFYLPTVPNQNDGLPVPFKLEKVTKNSIQFQNPKHDFPQYILYKLTGPRRMEVALGAFEDGKLEIKSKIRFARIE